MNRPPLTNRQKEIFDYIKNYINQNDVGPMYKQIMKSCKIKSSGHLSDILKSLKNKEYIKIYPGLRSGISIVDHINDKTSLEDVAKKFVDKQAKLRKAHDENDRKEVKVQSPLVAKAFENLKNMVN
tara:strand:- start:202 stop:579 length:378 start_codon:yes stop_codon:yes gene_type:complete